LFRSEDEFFDEIQDVKITKDMLDLANTIVNQKAGRFKPEKFEDRYETARVDLHQRSAPARRSPPKERPRGENVVDLRRSGEVRAVWRSRPGCRRAAERF
jgi:DNA end-binding protein Ku